MSRVCDMGISQNEGGRFSLGTLLRMRELSPACPETPCYTNLSGELPVESGPVSPMRLMRVLKYSFFGIGLLLIYIVIRIPAPSHPAPNPAFSLAVIAVALTIIALGFFVPRFLRKAVNGNSQNRPESTPLNRWMSLNLFSLACFDGSMLFGFVLHLLNAPARLAWIATAAGIIAILIWKPIPLPTTEEAKPFPS